MSHKQPGAVSGGIAGRRGGSLPRPGADGMSRTGGRLGVPAGRHTVWVGRQGENPGPFAGSAGPLAGSDNKDRPAGGRHVPQATGRQTEKPGAPTDGSAEAPGMLRAIVKGNRKGIDTSPGRATGVRRRRGALPRPARGPGCSTWNILCLSSLLRGGPVSGRRSPAARRSSAARWAALDVPRGISPVFLPFAGRAGQRTAAGSRGEVPSRAAGAVGMCTVYST